MTHLENSPSAPPASTPLRLPIALFLPDFDESRQPVRHMFCAFVGRIRRTVRLNINHPIYWGLIPLPIRCWPKDCFEKAMSISPSKLLERLGESIKNARGLSYAVFFKRVHFCLVVTDEKLKQHIGVFIFDVKDSPVRYAYHRHIRVRSDAGDLCAQFMKNVVGIYKDCDVTQIRLIAGYTAGGAVWPKYGFTVGCDNDLRRLVDTVKKRVESAPASILNNYKERTGRCLRQDIACLSQKPDSHFPIHVVDIDAHNKIRGDEHPHGIGAWLLQNTRWSATLNINDSESLGRLMAYINTKQSG